MACNCPVLRFYAFPYIGYHTGHYKALQGDCSSFMTIHSGVIYTVYSLFTQVLSVSRYPLSAGRNTGIPYTRPL